MKKALIVFAMMVAANATVQAVTIDGYAYLEGETVHDGIEIIFERTAPTSLFNTTFTNSSGYYSIDIEAGVYELRLKKADFLEIQIEDVLAYSSVTIPDTTMERSGLSGTLSGTLPSGVYNVDENVYINIGDSLNIEPGTVLRFRTGARFFVNGVLTAIGLEADSIVFTALDTTAKWNGILLQNETHGSSMSFCVIEYCVGNGIESAYSIDGFDIERSRISFCGDRGLYLPGDNILIQYVAVNQNEKGIWIGAANFILRNSEIKNNRRDAVVLTNSVNGIMENCKVIGNVSNQGIYCYCSSPQTYISNCLVTGFTGMAYSGAIHILSGSPVIFNCIIADNPGTGVWFAGGINAKLLYNTFWNNGTLFTGDSPDWLGVNVTTNANGDSCDPFFNIQMNPLFADTSIMDFRLQPGSPCLDAGAEFVVFSDDTIFAPTTDYDGNPRPVGPRWDMGVYEGPFTSISESPPSAKPEAFEISACPNPFNSAVTIAAPAGAEIEIFDVNGRLISVIARPEAAAISSNQGDCFVGQSPPRNDGVSEFIWHPDASLCSGVYLVRVWARDESVTKRIVYLK